MRRPSSVPIAIGAVLDRTFSLYRTRFRSLVGIMAAPMVLLSAATLLLRPDLRDPSGMDPIDDPLGVIRPALAMTGRLLVLVFLSVVVWTVPAAAMAGAVHRSVREEAGRLTAAGSYADLAGRWPGVLGLGLALGLMLAGGMTLVMMTAFLLGVSFSIVHPIAGAAAIIVSTPAGFLLLAVILIRYIVAIPALRIEGLSPRDALRRSASLTHGHRPAIALIAALMILIGLVAATVLQGPFLVAGALADPPWWIRGIGALLATAGGALTAPLLPVALTLVHIDRAA